MATGAFAAIGAVPLLGHMAPAPDSVADAGLEIDLSKLNEGEQMTISFLGRPIAIRYKTPVEIAAAQADDEADMIDRATDKSRLRPKPDGLIDPSFLVFVPICTHFGCVVVGEAGRFADGAAPVVARILTHLAELEAFLRQQIWIFRLINGRQIRLLSSHT